MKNVKTRLETYRSGHLGDERQPMTLTGEELEESTKQSNERTPMTPAGVQMEEEQPLRNKNEREPMKPVIPDNKERR